MEWENLQKPENHFTIRNAVMKDLRTNKIVQYYSANTKITVVQKCNLKGITYYRTSSAMTNRLDWAFEASAFGLPNEVAPLAPSANSMPVILKSTPVKNTRKPATKKKQKVIQPPKEPSNSGEKAPKKSFWAKLFRRKK